MDLDRVYRCLRFAFDVIDPSADIRPAGDDRYQIHCLYGHLHASGQDSKPSAIVGIGENRGVYFHCFACQTNKDLHRAIYDAGLRHNEQDLINLALAMRKELLAERSKRKKLVRGKVRIEDRPAHYEEKDHTAYWQGLKHNPWPAAMIELLQKKGCSEEVARRYGCVYSPDPSPSILLPALTRLKTGRLKCVFGQVRNIFQTPAQPWKVLTPDPMKGSRGRWLFGEQFYTQHIGDVVVLEEGGFDVMHTAEVMAGLPVFPLGLMGISISNEQAAWIKVHVQPRRVVTLLDPNMTEEGSRRTEKLREKFRRAFQRVGIPHTYGRVERDPKYLSRETLKRVLRLHE